MANILVVDDEKEIADLLELYLVNENYTVYKFNCSAAAIECIEKENIDLALLDVMLPDGNGFDICKKIRDKYNFPVIMLTAKGEETDKITGLTLGADDYITKPFRPLELIARVKAQLRRFTKYNTTSSPEDIPQVQNILTHGGLVINKDTHECTVDGKQIALTPTEFLIVEILLEKQGKVISAEELSHEIWGEEYFNKNNNTITTHVRHLREKMSDSVESPKYIKTVWGVGYKIEK